MERNKLLMLNKRGLLKLCKQKKIDTTGCLAKMDFVGKLLQDEKKRNAHKLHKENKLKHQAPNGSTSASKKTRKEKKSNGKKVATTSPKLTLSKSNPKKSAKSPTSPSAPAGAKSNKAIANNKTNGKTGTSSKPQQTKPESDSSAPTKADSPPKSAVKSSVVEQKKDKAASYDDGADSDSSVPHSSDEDDYSSDGSFELNVPEYIPARLSLTEVFDINILRNAYDEKIGRTKLNSHNLKIGAKRISNLSVQSNISALSPPIDYLENGLTVIAPKTPVMQTIQEVIKTPVVELDKDLFKRMDKALAQYYQYFEREYFDEDGVGKFTKYCAEHNLQDEQKLREQFGDDDNDDDPQQCPYLAFDPKFPLILMKLKVTEFEIDDEKQKENENGNNEKSVDDDKQDASMRLTEIYNVMEYCFHHGQSPYF
mmetsp:Transcript_2164/g.4187  ORF Transcript_2164/g.4187 Transcript_2164/m.4187 type:complete len:425 (-) Transcript_2164:166-1440(-)